MVPLPPARRFSHRAAPSSTAAAPSRHRVRTRACFSVIRLNNFFMGHSLCSLMRCERGRRGPKAWGRFPLFGAIIARFGTFEKEKPGTKRRFALPSPAFREYRGSL